MRRTALLTVAVLLATAAPAGAQATSSVTPNRAGKASKLSFSVDGLAPTLDGRLPRALTVGAPRGFRTDLRAVSKRCSRPVASLNECPAGSRIGSGSLLVEVTTPDGVRDTKIGLKVYLNSSRKILALAYVFGWQVVPGSLRTASGFAVTFDPLPSGGAFPNISYRLKQISLSFGASRVIKQRHVRQVNGTRRVQVIRRRVHLIRNPATCRRGRWSSSVSLTYRAGSPLVVPLAAPTECTA